MLQLLSKESDIKAAQDQFRRQLTKHLRKHRDYTIGFPGGSFDNSVHSADEEAIWYSTFLDDEDGRWINLFGFRDRLREGISNSIVVECNPPARGINRHSAGLYLREPTSGALFVGHRGRVGGGKKGIGKQAFRTWYTGNWQPFLDDDATGNRVAEGVVLSDLEDGAGLLARMSAFVSAVDEFKQKVVSGGVSTAPQVALSENTDDYASEFAGTKAIPPRDAIVAACDHGFVVEALVTWVRERFGNVVVNNRNRIDLLAIAGNRRILAEVKTDGCTTEIYTGLGQLMIYGLDTAPTERWLVVPCEAVPRWEGRLKKLGVRVLGYTGKGRRIRIADQK